MGPATIPMDIPAINNKAGKRCISGEDASMLPARKRHRAEGDGVDALSRATSFSHSKFRHEDYTVGWVAALPIELAAASAMLENRHPPLPTVQGDSNYYTYGNIGAHNIVIACLPSGHYGTINAAVVANNMARSFPSISIRLMVGIGGGVPKFDNHGVPESDIRLGDVVVGHDVLQYDFGKTVRGGDFTCTSHLVRPPQQISKALSKLRAENEQASTRIPSILAEMLRQNQDMINYGYPSQSQDRLFDTNYEHSDETQDCDQCDQSRLIYRPSRRNNEVRIHYGTIASGNQVVKHAASRDSWANRNNILCFEMEAAGLTDHFPCLVIRGICDYCDSHKNKAWQQYAAATAAAYAKELLQSIHPASEPMSRTIALDDNSINSELQQGSILDPDEEIRKARKRRMESLKFEYIDNRRMNIKRAHLKTCRWMLKKEEYLDWLDETKIREHGGFLWIKGKPGAGKSTMMKFISDASQKKRAHHTTLDFFFNARGHGLEKSTTGLYQSILFQLLTEFPALQDVLDCSRLFANETPRHWTNDLLKELIERVIEKLTSSVICYIDALDECQDDQIRDMIRFFERLGQLAISTGVGFYICFSSRHYPHISMREGLGLEITLEKQQHHGDDIRQYVDRELVIGHGKLADEIKNELLEKASGVFMWAVLVVKILNEERDRGRIHKLRQKLREIPKDLHELFRSILSQDHNNKEELLLCFQWILFSRRPLTLLELHVAILSQTYDPTQLDPEYLTEENSKIFLLENSRGLAEVANSKSPAVQLIHESVKDFLLKDNGLRSLFNDLNDNFPGQSHIQLRDCCHLYIKNDISLRDYTCREGQGYYNEKLKKTFPFLEYATNNLLFHANAAGSSGISQIDFLNDFDHYTWISLRNQFHSRHYDHEVDLLYILAADNAPSLVEEWISPANCVKRGPGSYGCPLLAAIVHGHRRVVEVFRDNIVGTLPMDDLAGYEERYRGDNTNMSTLNSCFTFASSNRSLISFLAEYGDLDLFLTLYHRQDRLQLPSAPQRSGYSHAHGESPFLCAVRNSHWEIARILLADGQIDLSTWNSYDRTRLDFAISKGRPDSIDRLLATGQFKSHLSLSLAASYGKLHFVQAALGANDVNPDLKDFDGRTPLVEAASKGHYEIVQALLASGRVCPDSKDNSGQTALSHAVRNGHLEVVQLLLATKQTWPDFKDIYGETPLSYASENGHLEIVQLLLATKHVCPDSKSKSGGTALSHAVRNGHLEIAQLLLATKQTCPDFKDKYGGTPLLYASKNGHLEVVQLLLATKQTWPDFKDKYGGTPLLYASKNGHLEIVQLLLAIKQTWPDSKDKYGGSPLSYASENGHLEIVRLLLAIEQVCPDSKDHDDRTPLYWAAGGGHLEVVKILLATGQVDPNSKCTFGTVLEHAIDQDQAHIVSFLLKIDQVDPNSRDKNGYTPLMLAAMKRFVHKPMKVLRVILKSARVDRDAQTDDGDTALSLARSSENGEAFESICRELGYVT
ncbi:unnamed protein product [Clonostachys byssicola]|uniref:Nucleoside phosphorylase domain-containing protein n=1 Tax=Clonostachys byssicola TaxID=160290 RepID=A0A9N9XYY8_9HYPO|nr:unnamed protein product [Clonostachys byssicola]